MTFIGVILSFFKFTIASVIFVAGSAFIVNIFHNIWIRGFLILVILLLVNGIFYSKKDVKEGVKPKVIKKIKKVKNEESKKIKKVKNTNIIEKISKMSNVEKSAAAYLGYKVLQRPFIVGDTEVRITSIDPTNKLLRTKWKVTYEEDVNPGREKYFYVTKSMGIFGGNKTTKTHNRHKFEINWEV